MKQTTHLARSATVAIAAALALGSTPLLAQDADPATTTVVPEVAPPAASPPVTIAPPAATAPASVVPAAPAPTVVSNPVVQKVQYPVQPPVAEPSAAPAATAKARTAPAAKAVTRTTTAQTTTRAAPAPVPPAANDVAPVSDAVDVLPPAPIASDTAPVQTEAQPATTARTSPLLNLVVLGGLAILVLAILAMLYRRFARRDRMARPETIAMPRTVAEPAPQPVSARTVAPAALPIATAPEPAAVSPEIAAVTAPIRADRPIESARTEPTPIRQNVTFGSAGRTPGALPSAGAAVDLPARIPEDYEGRSALLQRMIEAKPDKANPFRNRKSRAKRARLILQSLGRKFEHNDPWIDLSQYPNNWPELARRYSQAA
jgi:hypothetical protein